MTIAIIIVIWILILTAWNVIIQLNLDDVKDDVKRERKVNFKHRTERKAHDNI